VEKVEDELVVVLEEIKRVESVMLAHKGKARSRFGKWKKSTRLKYTSICY
jgi:hypothetical protein